MGIVEHRKEGYTLYGKESTKGPWAAQTRWTRFVKEGLVPNPVCLPEHDDANPIDHDCLIYRYPYRKMCQKYGKAFLEFERLRKSVL